MAGVTDINLQPINLLDTLGHTVETLHSQNEYGRGGEGDAGVQNKENEKPGEVGVAVTKEVKIDIETTPNCPVESFVKKQSSIGDSVPQPQPHEFSQETDAPEVSARVYDFNMVKQKTLPRINFGNNGVFHELSSQSKCYILAWTLMPVLLVVCIVVLVLYFRTQ